MKARLLITITLITLVLAIGYLLRLPEESVQLKSPTPEVQDSLVSPQRDPTSPAPLREEKKSSPLPAVRNAESSQKSRAATDANVARARKSLAEAAARRELALSEIRKESVRDCLRNALFQSDYPHDFVPIGILMASSFSYTKRVQYKAYHDPRIAKLMSIALFGDSHARGQLRDAVMTEFDQYLVVLREFNETGHQPGTAMPNRSIADVVFPILLGELDTDGSSLGYLMELQEHGQLIAERTTNTLLQSGFFDGKPHVDTSNSMDANAFIIAAAMDRILGKISEEAPLPEKDEDARQSFVPTVEFNEWTAAISGIELYPDLAEIEVYTILTRLRELEHEAN